MNKIFLVAVAALSIIAVAPAFAETTPPAPQQPTKVYVHRTYEHQQDDRFDHRYTPNLGRVGEIAISDNDKVMIGKYLNHVYKNKCAWEHDLRVKRCVTPQPPQKRGYIIGYALPDEAGYEDVPVQITSRLHPIPDGYKYVRVNDDVVLINASTREVVDAVTLLSTYGQ